MVRTSERTLFKECRLAWDWSYNQCFSTNKVQRALAFGSLCHAAWATYYKPGRKRGLKPQLAVVKHWDAYLAAGGRPYTMGKITGAPEDDCSPLDLAVEMMTNYYNKYHEHDLERYQVLSSEQTFQIDVNHPRTGAYLFTYVGTMDGVWKDVIEDLIVFAEHKTGAGLEPFGAPVYLDEQQASYWAYGPDWLIHQGILKSGQLIDHVLYNRARKAFSDTRPTNADGLALNQNGSVSKNQPTPLFKREPVYRTQAERARTMRRVISEVREMQLVRSGKLKIYKNPGKRCTMCQFRDPCEVHEGGGDYRAVLSTFGHWDPVEDHYGEVVGEAEE